MNHDNRWVLGVALVLVAGVLLSWLFWDDLVADEGSLSEVIRNLGLIIGGAIAVLFAIWRSLVASRQTQAAQEGLLEERYRQGLEMLSSGGLSTRLGGVQILQALAEEHPGRFHLMVMRLFCAFVRNPPSLNGGEEQYQDTLREDVQSAMDAIGRRKESSIKIEQDDGYNIDLRGAKLSHAQLTGTNLEGANLMLADLREADFAGFLLPPSNPLSLARSDGPWSRAVRGEGHTARLSRAEFRGADLEGATMMHVDLSGADLTRAKVSSAQLLSANLTGARLIETALLQTVLNDAVLRGADFLRAQLVGASLKGAILSGAKFHQADITDCWISGASFSDGGSKPAVGLTQNDLNATRWDSEAPPLLTGVTELGTGRLMSLNPTK
ncbi:MAG: pentapeptide repeat-containing protein [Chloroflexota bacterium]|nr:pentapeptide repeat-containing protein [Chloroflexota bacterium]